MKLKMPATKGHAQVVADPFWQELYDLLFQLRHLQLICCPDSGSHEEESRISPFNAELKKMYEGLSGGIRFNSFDSIKSHQIGKLALAWSEGREVEFDFDPKKAISADPNAWSDRFYIVFGDNPFISDSRLRLARAEMHAEIARLFRDVWGAEKRDFRYWYDLERFGYQGHLFRSVARNRKERDEAILAYRPGEEIPLERLEKVLPSFSEGMTATIDHVMRFPRAGGERPREERNQMAKDFILHNRIADAPFVKLQAIMFASIAMRATGGQKEPPNEGTTTDIDTVSHLLPYCDAMFMDNGCRSLLMDVPKDLRPPESVKVFSTNVREEFLKHLRAIRGTMSTEHIQAIRDIYGDRDLHGFV